MYLFCQICNCLNIHSNVTFDVMVHWVDWIDSIRVFVKKFQQNTFIFMVTIDENYRVTCKFKFMHYIHLFWSINIIFFVSFSSLYASFLAGVYLDCSPIYIIIIFAICQKFAANNIKSLNKKYLNSCNFGLRWNVSIQNISRNIMTG